MLRSATGLMLASFLTLCAADPATPVPTAPTTPPLQLFDGETAFGWTALGKARLQVDRGALVLSGESGEVVAAANGRFLTFELTFEYKTDSRTARVRIDELASIGFADGVLSLDPTREWKPVSISVDRGAVAIRGAGHETKPVPVSPTRTMVPGEIRFSIDANAEAKLLLRAVALTPLGSTSLFDGKTLTGWNVVPEKKSVWSVTKEGWLNVKNGPGDLQTREKYGDFLFQTEAYSNGDRLNSGIFFRCVDGQYQNGYEAQIHNGFKGDDRTMPTDYGTGAIYRRIAARKVVPEDRQWFSLAILADGKRLRTWVNGYPTVDWIDERKEDENPRKGSRTAPGHLSIQGHDPTTDLNFRNVRVREYPPSK